MAEEATSPAAETRAERHLRLLALLADRSVELACHLQEAALAAPDLTEKSRLARDFYFVDRAARQSILTEARLARQAVRDDRETEKHTATQATEAAAIRKARVQAGVERRIWTELDGEEAEAWTADLADRLDDEALAPGFADEDLDAHIDRTAQALGLTGEEHHDYVPRTLRRGFYRPGPSRHDWRAIIDKMDFDEEDEEDEAPPKAATPPPPEPPKAPAPPPAADDDAYEPDFGPPPDDEPPPPTPKRESEPEPKSPPEPPPPVPPPEPEPHPYIPPWEQIPRGHRFPGGDSGW